jgi:hypothetical protein
MRSPPVLLEVDERLAGQLGQLDLAATGQRVGGGAGDQQPVAGQGADDHPVGRAADRRDQGQIQGAPGDLGEQDAGAGLAQAQLHPRVLGVETPQDGQQSTAGGRTW